MEKHGFWIKESYMEVRMNQKNIFGKETTKKDIWGQLVRYFTNLE